MNVINLVTGLIADVAPTAITVNDRSTKISRDVPKAFVVTARENQGESNSEGVPYIAVMNAPVRDSRTIVANVFGFLAAER